jgi:hypothetical protein
MMSETEQEQVAQLLAEYASATRRTGVTSVGCGQGEVEYLVQTAKLDTIGIDAGEPRGAALQLGYGYKGLYQANDAPAAGEVSWTVVRHDDQPSASTFRRWDGAIDVDPLHVLLFSWGTRAPFGDYINQYVAAEGQCVVTVWDSTCTPTGDEVETQLGDGWVRADKDINGNATFSVFSKRDRAC